MSENSRLDRRRFLGSVGLASAGALLPASDARAQTEGDSGKLSVTVAGYPFDRVAALTNGKVGIDGCEVTFQPGKIGDLNTHVFSGPATYDVTEIGLHPFMLAWANADFRGYTLIPVFPLRVFRQKSIFIRTDRGIERPEDLAGRKVATPGFSSTSLTWIRGMLEDDYGVSQKDVEWYLSDTDSSAEDGGTASTFEQMVPDGLTVRRGPKGKNESDMLSDGDVDALFHAVEPKGFVEGDPRIGRLFSDYRAVEQDYYRRTGIFPIMHAVALRDATVEANPWLPEAVFRAYSKAKALDFEHMNRLGWAFSSLPWFAAELETTRELMGDDFYPYGIASNRKALETLFRYSKEQGLARRRLTIEELFHPSTLDLVE